MKTFEDLVRDFAVRGRKKTDPPASMHEVAETLGVSRVYLYALMRGDSFPRKHTLERIAAGLGRSPESVRKALLVT